MKVELVKDVNCYPKAPPIAAGTRLDGRLVSGATVITDKDGTDIVLLADEYKLALEQLTLL